MKPRTAALLLAGLFIGLPLSGQGLIRTNTSGAAFTPEGRGGQVQDIAGGRRFRAEPGALLKLRGVLQMPPAGSADLKLRRLAIHFRTSPSGPSLRAVELRNGSHVEFRIETRLEGDYTSREAATPDTSANLWTFAPISVGPQSVIRLEVQYPIGFDSRIDPGEFVLTAVGADFPRKLATGTTATTDLSTASAGQQTVRPAAPNSVIYAVTNNNELMWYAHSGRESGVFAWAAPTGRRVGTGWDVKQLFPGDDGVIYAITAGGDLMWYRHDGRLDGTFRWAAAQGRKVGQGWNFERVFSGGGGVIYAVTAGGDLMWYRHDGYRDGSFRWAAPEGKKVGEGWGLQHVFAGGDGVIYGVSANNDLMWYRHDGRGDGSFRWAAPAGKKVGEGWSFQHLFSAGDGVIYGINANGDLLWYRHDGRGDGSFRWADGAGKKVGTGWAMKAVFSGATLKP